jgi:hypothetical protein
MIQCLRECDRGHLDAPALLAGAGDNLLPVRSTLFDTLWRDGKVDPLAQQGHHFADAHLCGFLYGPVKAIALAQAQAYFGPCGGLGAWSRRLANLSNNGLLADFPNARCELAAIAVKQRDALANSGPQRPSEMACCVAFQQHRRTGRQRLVSE